MGNGKLAMPGKKKKITKRGTKRKAFKMTDNWPRSRPFTNGKWEIGLPCPSNMDIKCRIMVFSQ